MSRTFRNLGEISLRGKRVLLRVDLNVPLKDGRVADSTRLERVANSIIRISDGGGKVILLGHLGRPNGSDPSLSLKPVASALEQILHRKVNFVSDCIGHMAELAVRALDDGGILCLENTRFHAGEESNDPTFAQALARLGDVWINDAFSCAHRAHASTEGISRTLPSYAGPTMKAELDALTVALDAPTRPVVAIVGGSKVSTKLQVLENLLSKVDTLVIGGGMANTFLHAQGISVGASLVERDLTPVVNKILGAAEKANCKIILPIDVIVAPALSTNVEVLSCNLDEVPANLMILDLGPNTTKHIERIVDEAATVLWNGPLGAFEIPPFDLATMKVAKHVAQRTERGTLISVAGGGDTVAALNCASVLTKFTYVSTAGGAFLEWMEGKRLPGVECLIDPQEKGARYAQSMPAS